MNEKPKSKQSTDVPYNATIDPLPSGDFFASATEALRSEMNVSTTCNVNRYPHIPIVKHSVVRQQELTHRARDMHRSRPAQRVQMPSPLGHPIPDFVRVHRRVSRSERDDRGWGGPEDVEFRDGGGDGVGDVSGTGDDVAAGLEVAAGRGKGED